MNPDREKLIEAAKDAFRLEAGWNARSAITVLEQQALTCGVDAVLAVLQQDKTTEDQVVSAEGSPTSDPVSEPIRVLYCNHRGVVALRTITPWGVEWGSTLFHPEPQWLLTCYDHDRHAGRTFALRDCYFAAARSMDHASEPERQNQESSESSGEVSASEAPAVDPVSVAAADLVREGCREELGAEANWHRCNQPAEFVLWGKLIPPEGLGPRCYDHAAKHVGYHAVHPNSGYALMDLRPVQRALAAGSMAEPSEGKPKR